MSWSSVQKKTVCLLHIEGTESLKSEFKLHDNCHGVLSKDS